MRRSDFEGQEVMAGVYKIAATTLDATDLRDLGLDEKTAVVCIAVCTKVEHAQTKTGLARVHTLTVSEALPTDAVGEVADLLRRLRTEQRRKADELAGILTIEGIDVE